MKLTLRKLGLAAVLAASVAIPVAYASGLFQGFPIVGSAAFCTSTNSQSTSNTVPGTLPSNSNCTTTTPAGPSIVTGNEVVPADTGVANGAGPATVLLPLAALNALPITYSTISATAQTITPAGTSGGVFVHSTAVGGTITAITINLPAAPIDGQQFDLSADATLTSLTVQTNNLPNASTTIKQNPTVLTVSTTAPYGYSFWYNAASNTWNRLQ